VNGEMLGEAENARHRLGWIGVTLADVDVGVMVDFGGRSVPAV